MSDAKTFSMKKKNSAYHCVKYTKLDTNTNVHASHTRSKQKMTVSVGLTQSTRGVMGVGTGYTIEQIIAGGDLQSSRRYRIVAVLNAEGLQNNRQEW